MVRFPFAFLLFILCICSASVGFNFSLCKESERNALLKFKHSFFVTPFNHLGSWVGRECCSWKGVGCDNADGHVISVDLRGDFNSSSFLQAREVSPALLELKYLRYLDLSGNDFRASRLPEFFGSFRQLQYLNLSNAIFRGKIPPSLGNLTKLVVLDLTNYPKYGVSLETDTLKWAFKLKSLQHLALSGTDLSQVLDSLHVLDNLPSLSVLSLDQCGLGNSHLLPKNSTVSSSPLQHLNLRSNDFSGAIPQFIQNLSSIRFLDLSLNSFNETGIDSIEWASKLRNLQYLDLSGMDLSQALDNLHIFLNLPSLSVLNLENSKLGNSHLVFRNSTISSSLLTQLNLAHNLFSGSIPHFIQNLSAIRFLDLSGNEFNSPIPSWLGNKIDLKYFNLGSNSFNGSFPRFIENFTFLSSLDLSSNQFTSSIPSWLANKRYLEFLHLNNNHFDRVDGGIMNTIGHLCSLVYLDLSYNQLQEEVLESHVNFSTCGRYHLEYMNMTSNNLSGQLPTIKSLFSLQVLDLSHNDFEIIPSSFGELLSLEVVDLSYNNLIVVNQENLAKLSSLRDLDISSNSLNIDISPDWLPPFQLQFLHMLPCKLNSPFHNWLLSQEMLVELDLSDTGIYGPLPTNIGNAMASLEILQLANNSINGSIPRSLCNLESLQYLDIHHNMLSGKIPDCWMSFELQGMELSSNRLSGHIPDTLTTYGTLQLLSLHNNLLDGELPLSLSNCEELMVLDVGKNNLHGEIPSWHGATFPSLQILILRENKFNGIIPPQLCFLQKLQIIDLASNNLVGNIPPCFGHFEGMGSIQHSNDSRGAITFGPAATPIDAPIEPPSTTIESQSPVMSPTEMVEVLPPAMNPDEWTAVEVIKGEEREYTTVLHLLVNMDLSCNNLVGVIPAQITSLSLLHNLNLSHNHFTGAIPKEIGKMKSLESLDLSFNNLSGSIPESISAIDSLSKLDLSFNNLQGQIPSGRHLQTLDDPYTYMGNPRLCGDPLPKKCFGDNIAQSPTSTVIIEDKDEDNKHERMWFYLVIMSGFATGFWGVIGVLVVKKRWRHAFFQLAEELADWLYVRVAVRVAQIRGAK